MDDEQAADVLQQKGLKRTKQRLALLHHFAKCTHAQSYTDIKKVLKDTTDKSTLYRNLATFEEAGLVHSINDHSGVVKYAFGESPALNGEHAHFVCERCKTVYCVEETMPLTIKVPLGFKTKTVQTIIRGICSDC